MDEDDGDHPWLLRWLSSGWAQRRARWARLWDAVEQRAAGADPAQLINYARALLAALIDRKFDRNGKTLALFFEPASLSLPLKPSARLRLTRARLQKLMAQHQLDPDPAIIDIVRCTYVPMVLMYRWYEHNEYAWPVRRFGPPPLDADVSAGATLPPPAIATSPECSTDGSKSGHGREGGRPTSWPLFKEELKRRLAETKERPAGEHHLRAARESPAKWADALLQWWSEVEKKHPGQRPLARRTLTNHLSNFFRRPQNSPKSPF